MCWFPAANQPTPPDSSLGQAVVARLLGQLDDLARRSVSLVGRHESPPFRRPAGSPFWASPARDALLRIDQIWGLLIPSPLALRPRLLVPTAGRQDQMSEEAGLWSWVQS